MFLDASCGGFSRNMRWTDNCTNPVFSEPELSMANSRCSHLADGVRLSVFMTPSLFSAEDVILEIDCLLRVVEKLPSYVEEFKYLGTLVHYGQQIKCIFTA